MRANEFLTEEILAEVPLPPDWDSGKLNLQQTFKNRLKYALARAKRLGVGSSRVAMIIEYDGRPTALKVAKNRKGLAQNKAEIEILDGYAGRLPIVIPLIDYDKENKSPVWIQTELAKKVQAHTLIKLLHTPSMWFLMAMVQDRINPHPKRANEIKEKYFDTHNNLRKLTEQDWDILIRYASEIAELVKSTKLEISDLNNSKNWGVYNGRPVLIDLGFTSDTKELYGRFRNESK